MAYYSALQAQLASGGRSATPARAWRRNQNMVRYQFGASIGPVSHAVLIAIMLCVLGLIYLTQITKTSTYGYQIDDLKGEQNKLLSQQSDLKIENARLQALEHVASSDVAKNMTNPQVVDYVQ